jgi:hypothetical protein
MIFAIYHSPVPACRGHRRLCALRLNGEVFIMLKGLSRLPFGELATPATDRSSDVEELAEALLRRMREAVATNTAAPDGVP